MHICVILNNIGPYHDARFRALADLGIRVSVIQIATRVGIRDWVVDPSSRYSVTNLIEGDLSGQKNISKRDIEAVLNKISPDILAITGYGSKVLRNSIRWARNKSVKSVVFTETQYEEKRRFRVIELYKKILLRNVDYFFTSGIKSYEYLRRLKVPCNKILLGYSVVENSIFASDESPKYENNSQKAFLYVGRIAPEKNLRMLIDGFNEFQKAVTSSWVLKIVGDGPQKEELQEKVELENIKNIKFYPFQQLSDLKETYHSAACFVLPSTYEPWGLVINEAMAAGLPIICSTQCGASKDLVTNSINGYTFNALSHSELVESFKKVSSLTAQQLRMFSHASLLKIQLHSPENWARQLASCY